MVEKKLILSISMLISNRVDTIRNSMESLRPILEQLPSELIIVDTVGEENSDGSLAIAKEYATKVIHFDWCDDFSAARNAGLELATGEWFMYMDDDEWFDDVSEIISFFKSGDYQRYGSARYTTRNYWSKKGTEYNLCTNSRMVRIEKGTRFCGKVHEYLNPYPQPEKTFQAFTHHYGYAYETEEERLAHVERNVTLLRPMLEETPEDLRLRLQMVQECMFIKHLEQEALQICEGTFSLKAENYMLSQFQWIMTAYVRIADRNKESAKVLKQINELRNKFPISTFTNLALLILEIRAQERLGNLKRITELSDGLCKAYQSLMENPEQRNAQNCLDFDIFLRADVMAQTLKTVILAMRKCEKKEEAEKLCTLRWSILKKPVLSVSMLVSNRKDTIEKCMKSLQTIQEQLPSELIIVDTVGEENSDGSLAIAKEYATKVVHFDWCNDFAAARNTGLKLATGEWFMFMDDDEWFEDTSEIIEFFKSGEYLEYGCATYQIRSYTNKEGAYSVGNLSRMVRMEQSTRFYGKVHEYLTPVRPPEKNLKSFIHHYGYVFDTEEEHIAHSDRNLTLLRPEFEKNPEDLRLRLQMVQECMYLKHLEEEAVQLCEGAFQLKPENYILPQFQWIITSYVRLADRNKNWDIVINRIKELRSRFPISAFSNLAFFIMEIKAQEKLEYPERVVELAKGFCDAYHFLKEHPEQQSAQSCLDFDVFLEPDILAATLKSVIVAMHKLGKKEEATKLCKLRQSILNKPILSISMLVSNRKDMVPNCMKSLQPILEQVPSELVVVDTVGEEHSDGSLAIAKEYATKIVHFDWCNDFSAARNAGLEKTSGEWLLIIDDDEWFEDASELINFFNSGEYLSYFSASYPIRNYTNLQGSEYNEATLVRLVRKGKNTKYVGAVHETFTEVFLPCKNLSSFVHHYGYAYASQEEKVAHTKRNSVLLEAELKKNPSDLRYRTQMALELATYDNEGALRFCQDTFRLCYDQKEKPGFQWQLSLVFRLYEALGTDAATARATYEEFQKQYGLSETAENAICFQLVRIHILCGEHAAAYPYAARYFWLLDFLQNNPEQQQVQMTADFLRYQNEAGVLEQLHFGAYCAWQAKAYADAWKWYREMPWEKDFGKNKEAFGFLYGLAQENLDKEKLLHIVKRVMKNSTMTADATIRNTVAEMLQKLKQTEQNGPQSDNLESSRLEPNWIKSDIKLTIGILVSNNIKTIRNCMESLKPILEQVPSELIVVDTVGEEHSDGSLAVAKEYATKVLHFDWCNDFAAARNCYMEEARGEWLLFVDDDEWFEDTREIIEFFNSGECNQYGVGLYPLRSYTADGKYTVALAGRFYRRTPNTRFEGKVHEHINEIFQPSKVFDTYAHHMGYKFDNTEEQEAHLKRNVSILEEELKVHGYTPHLCAQLVQEWYSVERTRKQGYDFCLECIPVLVEEKGLIAQVETQWLLVASARYFSMNDDYENLLLRTDYLRKNYRLSQMANLFLSTIVAGTAYEKKDYAVVEQEIINYITMWDWLKAHPDSVLTQTVLDLNRYYNTLFYCKLLHMGAICANEQKKYELANLYWKLFPWNEEGVDRTLYKEDMIETLQGLKNLAKK